MSVRIITTSSGIDGTPQILAPITQSAARVTAGEDALTSWALSNLSGFITWLSSNGLTGLGYIGEIGWPNDSRFSTYNAVDDPYRWNRLGTQYMNKCMAAGFWVTLWHASTRLDGHYTQVYSPPHGTATGQPLSVAETQAAVLEGLYPLSGKIGVNWENGEDPFPTGAGLGTSQSSNVREASGWVFNALGQPMVTGSLVGRASAVRSVNAWDYGDAASYAFLASRPNMSLIRLPFRWERVQRSMGGALDTTELARLDTAIAAAGAVGLQVILDLHNFGAYFLDNGTQGVGQSIGGATVTSANFSDLWTKLSTHYASNTTVVAYGLCNEPGVATNWTTVSQAALAAIRANSDTKLIMVQSPTGNILDFNGRLAPWITDSANNFRYEAHDYFGTGASFPSSYDTYNNTYAAQGFTPERVTGVATPVLPPSTTGSSLAQSADAIARLAAALEARGITPKAAPATDNFQRADVVPPTGLAGFGGWQSFNGGIGISGGQAYPSTTVGGGLPLSRWGTNLNDAAVTATIVLSSGRANVGVVGRHYIGDTWSGIYAQLQKGGTLDNVSLYKQQDGLLLTQKTGFGLVLGATYTLQLLMVGSNITVLVNGATALTYTLTAGETAEFVNPTAVQHGIFAKTSSNTNDEDGGSRFLNFSITTPPPPTLVDTTPITTSTASRQLLLADTGTLIQMSASTPNHVTLPLDAILPFPAGATIEIVQAGTGLTTIQGAYGTTLNKDTGVSATNNQWAVGKVRKLPTANTWLITGNLGASVASFTPDDLVGLVAWFKADAISGLTDGQSLATWPDSSPSAINLSQATGGSQPVYKTAVQNGLPVVRFNGTSSSMQAGARVTLGQVFVVAKYSAATFASYAGLVSGSGSTGADIILTGTGGGTTFFNGYGFTVVYVLDGNSLAQTAMSAPMNSFNLMSIASTGWANPALLLVGLDRNVATRNWNGDICEIVGYNTQLAPSDQRLVEQYLQAKWATPALGPS